MDTAYKYLIEAGYKDIDKDSRLAVMMRAALNMLLKCGYTCKDIAEVMETSDTEPIEKVLAGHSFSNWLYRQLHYVVANSEVYLDPKDDPDYKQKVEELMSTQERNETIFGLVRSGESIEDVADCYELSAHTVRGIVWRLKNEKGVTIKRRGNGNKEKNIKKAVSLAKQGKNNKEISAALGIAISTVENHLWAAGYKREKKDKHAENRDTIISMVENYKTNTEIAEAIGSTVTAVASYLHRTQISRSPEIVKAIRSRPKGKTGRPKSSKNKKRNKKIIELLNQSYSNPEIAAELSIPVSTVSSFLHTRGIVRNKGQRSAIALKAAENKKPWEEWDIKETPDGEAEGTGSPDYVKGDQKKGSQDIVGVAMESIKNETVSYSTEPPKEKETDTSIYGVLSLNKELVLDMERVCKLRKLSAKELISRLIKEYVDIVDKEEAKFKVW